MPRYDRRARNKVAKVAFVTKNKISSRGLGKILGIFIVHQSNYISLPMCQFQVKIKEVDTEEYLN